MMGSSRIPAIDSLRGFLLLLMLLEHSRQLLSGVVMRETKAFPVGPGGDVLPLVIRSLSHLCAPGFFFLLGVGMVLRMSQSSVPQQVWAGYVRRGLALVLLQFSLENGAWALSWGMCGRDGGQAVPFLYFGVLFGLGGSLVLAALLWHLKDHVLFGVALVLVSSSLWNLPEQWHLLTGWLVDGFLGPRVEISYPLLPWGGITLLGVLFARRAMCQGRIQRTWALTVSITLVALLAGCWLLSSVVPEAALMYKYPPSPLYVIGALLVLMLGLHAFSACARLNVGWLQLIGRHSLVFYLAHLYLLGFVVLMTRTSSMVYIVGVAIGVGVVTASGCWWVETAKGVKLFHYFAPWYDRFMLRWGLYPVAAVKDALRPGASGCSLLDVGGGTGYLAACVADRYARVVVVDASAGMLELARRRNLEAVEASALELPFRDGTFEVVMCTDALHHVKRIDRALSEMSRVLKPGGTILIHEFHIRGLKGFCFYWFERLLVDDSVFVTPAELQVLLEKNGFAGEIRMLSGLEYSYVGHKGRLDPWRG